MTAITYSALEHDARARFLSVLGVVVEDGQSLALLGPDEPGGFWAAFSKSREMLDGQPDPMDRWSARVIGDWAQDVGATALFPFGGPPHHPFYSWALKSGRVFESPVRFLVHDTAGLWVSFRGALRFPHEMELPAAGSSPCDTCADRPCENACPVGALGVGRDYRVDACKTHVRAADGAPCRDGGCRVRALCPVSREWGRVPEQSAFHMKAFAPI